MAKETLSVREICSSDIDHIIHYWLSADAAYMKGMGVDLDKMPARDEWVAMLTEQISQDYDQKKSYCIIWLIDGQPSGHSNINKIISGKEAYMHLHMWNASKRKKGMGTTLVKMTLPWFFEKYRLEKIYSEPYALNPAPHRTLEKAGFELIREYITTPGWINFEQPVKLWEMTFEKFKSIK